MDESAGCWVWLLLVGWLLISWGVGVSHGLAAGLIMAGVGVIALATLVLAVHY